MESVPDMIKPSVLIGIYSSSLVTCTEPFNYLQPSPLSNTWEKTQHNYNANVMHVDMVVVD